MLKIAKVVLTKGCEVIKIFCYLVLVLACASFAELVKKNPQDTVKVNLHAVDLNKNEDVRISPEVKTEKKESSPAALLVEVGACAAAQMVNGAVGSGGSVDCGGEFSERGERQRMNERINAEKK